MGLRLYCNRYTHFKDPLVCSVVCPYRTRCQDFALFYDAHRSDIDALVEGYYAAQAVIPALKRNRTLVSAAAPTEMRALIKLEVKREMPETTYIWIGKDDQAELLNLEEIIRRAERGAKAKNIYKIAQEMELRFQLVPRKRIEKAKRTVAAEAERAAARRSSRLRAVSSSAPAETPVPQPLNAASASGAQATQTSPARRTRTRAAKAAGER
ncbi:MAG TPA: hypothetical protein VF544_15720 [Pyrinomonadaceae bacterium]|jgi:hypothetical protein